MRTCGACGSENPDSAGFCSACGLALSASPGAREVRKTVTVLFADVTESTVLGEQLDPESLRRVMARYFDLARAAVERHGGTVEKFIGDAVMAVFGVPTLHEDDALRALRAASELRDALRGLNEELESDYGVALQLRTGVNTGEVVTGTEERLATGDAADVAARLEQAAPPGEILVGERTRALARGAIEVEAVEPLLLKGKADPVAAYRLVHVVEGADAFERRDDAPFVGRLHELAAMEAAFNGAIDERACRLVTVLGPPGIGKSRLTAALIATIADRATVVSGRCVPYGEGITYLPLAEIFRAGGAEHELDAILHAGGAEEIAWSVRKAFERLARERPLAVVVEDIHWAEETLLDLLEHLTDWTRDAPILLVCLARPDLIDLRPAWGGQPGAETVTLEPLSAAESDELIGELAGHSDVDAETLARVAEIAEGNPLFVEQLLAQLAEDGRLGHVPATIQALLATRLDSLPDEEREVLERASVVGLEFEWDALAKLSPRGRRPGGATLATLVRKELIQPHEAIEDAFRFRHMLIRDAAYERIPKELRSELHERFSTWLDGRGDEFDEVIGYHLEQAYLCLAGLGRPGERGSRLAARGAELLEGCGRRAHARGDAAAAENLVERAIGLLPEADERRLGLLPLLGRLRRDRGHLDQAEALLSEAEQRAPLAGLRGVAADARLALVDLRFHGGRAGIGRVDVLRVVDDASRVFIEVGDEAGLARALNLGGKLRFWGGEAATAVLELDRAAQHAHLAGARAEEADSLHYICVALRRGPTPADEGLERIEEIGLRNEQSRALETVCLVSRAGLEAMLGRFDVARGLLAKATASAQELGREVLIDAHIRVAAADVELLAGEPEAAEELLRLSCGRLEQIGELGFLASTVPSLVEAVLAQGRTDEALELSDRWRPEDLTVPEDVDAQVAWRRVRAMALSRLGQLDEAERLAREAIDTAATTDFTELHASALAVLGEVLRLSGRAQESTAALEQAVTLFEAKGNLVALQRVRTLFAAPAVEA